MLADLGSPTMPEDVAGRLEDTLARLSEERQAEAASDSPGESPEGDAPLGQVVPLRRRWARIGTIAAAAVIVVGAGGVALNQFVQDDRLAESTAGSAESADDAGGGSNLAQSPTPGSPPAPSQAEAEALARELPAVRPRSFADDVSRLLDTSTARRAVPGDEKAGAQAARPTGCPGPRRPGPGTTTLPIRYDGVLSALVVHPERSGRRLVEVWDCGGQARLATAQVARQD
jgi:hypothetical protein